MMTIQKILAFTTVIASVLATDASAGTRESNRGEVPRDRAEVTDSAWRVTRITILGDEEIRLDHAKGDVGG